MSSKPDTSTTTIDPRYFKLHYLINAKATELLRGQFTSLWALVNGGEEWGNAETSGRRFIDGIGKEFIATCQKHQRKYIASGNIHTWDLALLCGAIRTLCQQLKNPPFEKYITIKEMDELKEIRNTLAHLGSTTIEAQDFDKFWTTAVGILERLGLTQDDVNAVSKLQCVNVKEDKVPSSKEDEAATKFKEMGNSAFRANEYGKAIDFYTKAIHCEGISTSTLGILYSNRSAASLALGTLEDAEEDAKRAVTLKPYWAKAYSRLAAVYERKEKYWKSLVQYKIALSLEPKNEGALEGVDFCKMKIANLALEQHLDPLHLQSFQVNPGGREGELDSVLGLEDSLRKQMVIEGNPHSLCGEGHRYFSGQDRYKQDYVVAARYYAEARSKGSAEGTYNLASLTAEGKGVRRDLAYSHQLLLEAAGMEPSVELIDGCGIMTVRIGVMEAQHALGLNHEQGIVVQMDDGKAAEWYKKAIDNGFGHSANNLAILYSQGRLGLPDDKKAVLYWKLASYRGVVLAMDGLFFHYYHFGEIDLAQEWFDYAMAKGSMALPIKAPYLPIPFRVTLGFDEKSFTNQIREDLLKSELKDLVPIKNYMRGNPLIDIHGVSLADFFSRGTKTTGTIRDPSPFINHHAAQNNKKNNTKRQNSVVVTTPAKFKASSPSMIGLKPITFKEFEEAQADKIYKGFAIQVQTVTDVSQFNAISMVVMDENGDFGRVFIYNYPSLRTMQDEVGFGSWFTVINPYYKRMTDGMMGIRVEDPNCVLKLPHLRDPTLCRFCFKTGAGFKCRRCIRAKYCSKKCYNDDLEQRSHQLMCKKKI